MANIKIVVGSTYGNAQSVAEDAAQQLQAMGNAVDVLQHAVVADLMRDDFDTLIVCTATIGDGEVPENLLPLYESLEQGEQDLAHLQYAVIALGDSSYDNFAQAGMLMNEVLEQRSANLIQEALYLDACEMHKADDLLFDWIQQLQSQL